MTPENHPRTERPTETDARGPTGPPERPERETETDSCDDQRLTEEVLLADLRQVAQDVEGELTEREYADRGRFGVTTYRRRFGSWNAAKRAADLETIRRAEVSEEYLVDDLERIARVVDGPLTEREYVEHGAFGVSTYRRRFGSWNAAKRAAGLQTSRRPELTDEALADDLARLADETDQRYVTPALYAAEGTYWLSELPEDREFWESMFGRLGIQISPLYHRFASDSEEAAPPTN